MVPLMKQYRNIVNVLIKQVRLYDGRPILFNIDLDTFINDGTVTSSITIRGLVYNLLIDRTIDRVGMSKPASMVIIRLLLDDLRNKGLWKIEKLKNRNNERVL